MKKLENKETELTKEVKGKEVKMGFVDLLLVGLNAVPERGFSVSQMKERFNVISKIEDIEIGKVVELEDAEFKVAFDCRTQNWAMMHKDIIAFEDYLQEINK